MMITFGALLSTYSCKGWRMVNKLKEKEQKRWIYVYQLGGPGGQWTTEVFYIV